MEASVSADASQFLCYPGALWLCLGVHCTVATLELAIPLD
uniref:Uncharacterized protein n=1 Tax=Anguilla anguilla TaxID=7936 RepID=A0A0E9STA8_ANGAN